MTASFNLDRDCLTRKAPWSIDPEPRSDHNLGSANLAGGGNAGPRHGVSEPAPVETAAGPFITDTRR